MSNVIKRFISTGSVKWKLLNAYAKNPTRKSEIVDKVVDFSKNEGIDKRGAESAEIASTEHVGGTDPNEGNHVTVEFKKGDGTHLTTKHVPV